MKKLIYIIIIAITFGSCDSLVEEEVFSIITPNNFFQNEKDVTTALVGVYDGIQDNNIWWRLFYTTEMTGGLMRHKWNPWAESMVYEDDNGDVWQLWTRQYHAISRANAVLSALEESTLDEGIKTRYEAELKFLRAHTYFNLVRLFGQIPLVTKSAGSLAEVMAPDIENPNAFESEFLKQRDRADIYAFIIEDLQFAELNLPPVANITANEAGRVASGAASGLLARVYLAMAGKQYDYNSGELVNGDTSLFAKVADQCTKVRAAGYGLLDNYADVFEVGNNNEIIFSIQYLESAIAGVEGEGNQIMARTAPARANGFTPYAWLQCTVNETFWEDFITNNSKDDKRYRRTFLEYYLKDGDTIWHGSSATFARPTPSKFYTDLGPNQKALSAQDYGADWIVMRFADVLLMESEALNESGGSPDANTIRGINEVRSRANKALVELPVTKEELRELIWQERKWELCYEGLHYFDSQRTGRLIEEYELYPHTRRKADATSRHYIYPLPFNAREANPSLNQNMGW